MKQYLIIMLDDMSTSYCHYDIGQKKSKIIPLDILKKGILWGMKENLMIQYLMPDYKLPEEYKEVMNSIDHHIILSSTCEDDNAVDAADIIVFNDWTELQYYQFDKEKSYVLRTLKSDFFDKSVLLKGVLKQVSRLNVTFLDVDTFSSEDFDKYKINLNQLSVVVEEEYMSGHFVQFNLLTDRMMLKDMNNCGAGDSNITLAPNGKFYACPAFYYDGVCNGTEVSLGDVCHKGYDIGSIKDGLIVKNPQLYKIDYAPLCRKCDAFQCKRCIWLNRKTTLEVNTPSHEQCVLAHLERNASRELLLNIRKHGKFLPEQENIKEIDYLDPFDKRDTW